MSNQSNWWNVVVSVKQRELYVVSNETKPSDLGFVSETDIELFLN